MTLTDGDVAALARQAIDLLDPQLDIAIAPEDRSDPYRWGKHAWVIRLGDLGSLRVDAAWTPTQALIQLVDTMSNDIAETSRFWGVAFPQCLPGHPHPTRVDVDGNDVVLTCPRIGETVARLVPDLPG